MNNLSKHNNVSTLFSELQENINMKLQQKSNADKFLFFLKEDNDDKKKNKKDNDFDKLDIDLDKPLKDKDNDIDNFVDLDLEPPENIMTNGSNENISPPDLSNLDNQINNKNNNTEIENEFDELNLDEPSMSDELITPDMSSISLKGGMDNNLNPELMAGNDNIETDNVKNEPEITNKEEETYFDNDNDEEIVDVSMEDEDIEDDDIKIITQKGEEKLVLMDDGEKELKEIEIFEIDNKYLDVILDNDWDTNIFIIDNNNDDIKVIEEIIDVDDEFVYVQLIENKYAVLCPLENLENDIEIFAINIEDL